MRAGQRLAGGGRLTEYVTVERADPNASLSKRKWCPIRSDGDIVGVLVKCPRGHIGSLDEHSIQADGVVSPSVDCDNQDCDFHEHVRLDDWDDGIKRRSA